MRLFLRWGGFSQHFLSHVPKTHLNMTEDTNTQNEQTDSQEWKGFDSCTGIKTSSRPALCQVPLFLHAALHGVPLQRPSSHPLCSGPGDTELSVLAPLCVPVWAEALHRHWLELAHMPFPEPVSWPERPGASQGQVWFLARDAACEKEEKAEGPQSLGYCHS